MEGNRWTAVVENCRSGPVEENGRERMKERGWVSGFFGEEEWEL